MLLHTEEGASSSPRCIREGDLAIVYERFDSMKAVTVTPNGTFGNKFGNFLMKDWIGRPFGSKMRAKPPSSGWVYVLAPTPELWTQVLRHRTQILYVADISMVCTMMELQPGCTVLESGTGSGSLTSSLVRAVAPTGHVHTFEFHEQRAATAAEEFKDNGLGELVTVTHRDIEGQGFPETLHGKADALFLDLPGPWKVVPSASQCLRPDGVFCSFSPCIEQVQRTCEALNSHGFRDLRTMEVLLRQYEVTTEQLGADLLGGGGSGGTQQGGQRGRQQGQGQGQQQGGPEGQPNKRQKMATPQQLPNEPDQQAHGVAAAAEGEAGVEEQAGEAGADMQEGVAEGARVVDAHEASEAQDMEGPGAVVQGVAVAAAEGEGQQQRRQQQQQGRQQQSRERRVLARPVPQGRGHTGYLTFARKAVGV